MVGITFTNKMLAFLYLINFLLQLGLYSEFMACSLYCIFGTCKELTIGPTAIMALMIHKFVADSQDFAVIIAFLSGIVILILGSLNLGIVNVIQSRLVKIVQCFCLNLQDFWYNSSLYR